MAGLSPKALRLYDEPDLLVLARVDPENGYRWYSAEQLGPPPAGSWPLTSSTS